jgi:hypothetical protein
MPYVRDYVYGQEWRTICQLRLILTKEEALDQYTRRESRRMNILMQLTEYVIDIS